MKKVLTILLKQYIKNKEKIIIILKLISQRPYKQKELSKELKIKPEYIHYYINGKKESIGLIELGLINKVYNEKLTQHTYHITEEGKTALKLLENKR